ncbi:hypothetical protein I6A60_11405 [Frankia sp. AgB1.9]|uniref:hypothetical protein n=1 Tax=unclassified Frankia TaxID=2632575 RepID=UPI0019321C76|nr:MULTISPECIES: hypothetical protein [unclassified Frankia]MBL7490364.1 hypothetical protein [Frankia sp. AgW1.1]MBL7548474.1 hypothetical protein [Frankia sp. AgB1.9]MBL7621364.1 hypothetical protein [Frankia sp. AgB1.8]
MTDDLESCTAELREIRRGRGVLADDLHARIGPHLRRACGITAADEPGTVRRKLTLELTGLCGRLPADLRLAVLAALAMHESTDQKFLHERMAWAAGQFDRDPRTARRRMDEGFRALAVLIGERGAVPEPDNGFAPDGWYVESLRSSLRLDLPVPKLLEVRRIVAAVDELDEVVAGLGALRGEPDDDLDEIQAEVVHGGEITEVRRPGRTYASFVIRLPQPLQLGQRHEYSVEFTAYPRSRFQPYYLLSPVRRVDRFTLKVRFGTDSLPDTVWRLNGIPGRVADEFIPNDDRLAVDSVGEIATEFHSLRQGLRYGVQWAEPTS